MKDGDTESIYAEIWRDTFGIDAFTNEEFEKLLEYRKFLRSFREK